MTHIQVPRDDAGGFLDSGQWRDLVDHWHLVISEWRVEDRERFDDARVAVERMRPTHGIARNPTEVMAWVQVHAPRTAYGEELAFWYAMRGRDCLRLRALGENRIAHVSAYAMSSAFCSCDDV